MPLVAPCNKCTIGPEHPVGENPPPSSTAIPIRNRRPIPAFGLMWRRPNPHVPPAPNRRGSSGPSTPSQCNPCSRLCDRSLSALSPFSQRFPSRARKRPRSSTHPSSTRSRSTPSPERSDSGDPTAPSYPRTRSIRAAREARRRRRLSYSGTPREPSCIAAPCT